MCDIRSTADLVWMPAFDQGGLDRLVCFHASNGQTPTVLGRRGNIGKTLVLKMAEANARNWL